MSPLPTLVTPENMRKLIAGFQSLSPAPEILITPTIVEIIDPRGNIAFKAKRQGNDWSAECIPGLIKRIRY